MRSIAWSVVLAALTGCGPTAWVEVAHEDSFATFSWKNGVCDDRRTLKVALVTEGASLWRDLPAAGLSAGDYLPPLDVEALGVSSTDRAWLIDLIRFHLSYVMAPFEVEVVAEGASWFGDDLSGEVVSRIILTQIPGVPEHCGCQGMTGALGLPRYQSAEAVVFVNAFLGNGLVEALKDKAPLERGSRLGIALTNSVAHELGHTLGLVHLDVPGPPIYFMARGGSSPSKLSLEDMTTLQRFSDEALPVTPDSVHVRETQCCACVMEQTLQFRRRCQY